MPTSVKNMAVFIAHPDKVEQLEELLVGLVLPSRSEPGNLQYDLYRDRADSNRFVLDETYVDGQALEAHRATPHFQNYLSKIRDLADRTAMVLSPVKAG